jgi:hypothetical protein
MARRLGGYATAHRPSKGMSSWDSMVREYDSLYHDTFAEV